MTHGDCMIIDRKQYLDKLIRKRGNGRIKVITGIRRCGKSYLLFELYKNYLLTSGVEEKYIIELALDSLSNSKYRNPIELDNYIRTQITESDKTYYILLDEIQEVENIPNPYLPNPSSTIGFVDLLLGLMRIKNADIYVTGSNSKMLSSDVVTEFRGRGDEIRVYPLTYAEFYTSYEGDKSNAWREYSTYGGMPYVLFCPTHEEKREYLEDLFNKVYVTDILERHNIFDTENLDDILNVISSAIGSLTNPYKLSATFKSVKNTNIAPNTIKQYLDFFSDAFILYKAHRYDVKGKKYINTPLKYYFSDVGLRNARLNFRQYEETHILENILYCELIARNFDVDIGVVEYNYKDTNNKSKRVQLEVDFVANKGSQRYYIQSVLSIADTSTRKREINSLTRIPDSFKKIVVVRENIIPWHDENGILYIGVEQFLLEKNAMDL